MYRGMSGLVTGLKRVLKIRGALGFSKRCGIKKAGCVAETFIRLIDVHVCSVHIVNSRRAGVSRALEPQGSFLRTC